MSSSGRNLLKTGSSTTGATKLSSRTSRAAPTAATTGQDEGKSTAAPTSPAMPAPVSTAPIPTPLTRSRAYSLPDWREKPNARSCVSPSQIESGSRTSAERTTRSAPSASAPSAPGSGSTIDGERVSRPGERDEREQCEPDREVGEDRAVARIVVPAGGVRVDHGRGCSNDRLMSR